jgi:hypothetical protein
MDVDEWKKVERDERGRVVLRIYVSTDWQRRGEEIPIIRDADGSIHAVDAFGGKRALTDEQVKLAQAMMDDPNIGKRSSGLPDF